MGSTFVHASAQVEPGAEVGDGTHIWHLCQVRAGARIGRECTLGRGVFIDGGVVVGDYVKIQNYVSVFHGVEIERGVFVGPHVCFSNDLYPRAVNPDMTPKGPDDWVLTPTLVREGASIGANASIRCGVTLGRWSMVGMGAVVVKDVPDFGLVIGNPARLIGFTCACGERHVDAQSAAHCPRCRVARDGVAEGRAWGAER
jgi:UDP-2-acetamido-3-amino-2,3-dideoxy-glucuronate N-acetyltransferase